jgi:pimeloyl-ACP methyl ester carboxylesterase
MPLVLFISYRSTPIGWSVFGPTCQRQQVIFAEPLNAGNSTPSAERIRIVLDVLDDIRRNYTIDPDRTYIAGYSGGGNTAARIALALPEYFGGVIASNAVVPLPNEPSRLQRLRDRLSVVMFAGQRESLALNVGRLDGPILTKLGVRTAYSVIPGLGHHMPSASAFDAAYRWLEEDVARRRALANARPATRIANSISRPEQAKLFFADAKELLEDRKKVHIGLVFMKEIAQRWPDLPVAAEAGQIFQDYKGKESRPWEQVARVERLARTLGLAQIYDGVSQEIGLAKLERAVVAQAAIDNWRAIITDSDDPELVDDARMRIAPLRKLVANTNAKVASTAAPVEATINDRFERPKRIPSPLMISTEGPTLSRNAIESLGSAIAAEGIELVVDEEAIDASGLTLDRRVTHQGVAQTASDFLLKTLNPLGLTYRFEIEQRRIVVIPAVRKSTDP